MDQRLIQIQNKALFALVVGMDLPQQFRASHLVRVLGLELIIGFLCSLAHESLGLVVGNVRARETAAHHAEAVHKGVAGFHNVLCALAAGAIVIGIPLASGHFGGSNRLSRSWSGSVAIRIGLGNKIGNCCLL